MFEFKLAVDYMLFIILVSLYLYHLEACPTVTSEAEGRKQKTPTWGPAQCEKDSFPLLLRPKANLTMK